MIMNDKKCWWIMKTCKFGWIIMDFDEIMVLLWGIMNRNELLWIIIDFNNF
jgi:hypothetical protein